jgi:carboxynorspermidine decarboxylase
MDTRGIDTPCYVLDAARLEANLGVIRRLQAESGCRVLLALKAFATFGVFPLMRPYLSGTAASSLYEARLGFEEFGGQVHVCAPAYRDSEFDELTTYCSHMIFNSNSLSQWRRFKPRLDAGEKNILCGIRINPEHSEVETTIYDPCAEGSRLGIRRADLDTESLEGISGLHFHTLCESDTEALARTLEALEDRFAPVLARVDWVNFGGGHHIARPDYDVDGLAELARNFMARYDVQVYLEPGEGIVMNAGVLVTSVLDVLPNGAVLVDASATAHAPDVLEMPYRATISEAGKPGELAHTYRLGGPTCMAGDVFGEYSFAEPLRVGDRLVFEDMAPYTMVKNTMFNGVPLPSIAVQDPRTDGLRIIRRFGYEDYRSRLS